MLTVYSGDQHLAPYIWQDRKRIYDDSYTAWDILCSDTVCLQAAYGEVVLVLGGDTFDSSNPDAYTEYRFAEGVRKMLQAGIIVVGIEGTHDKSVRFPRMSLFGVRPLSHDTITTVYGKTYCGLHFRRNTEELNQALAQVPPCDYLVTHAPFRHLLGFEGVWKLQETDIPEYIGKVLAADIHVMNITGKIYSSGSTHPRSTTEFEHRHGYFVFNDKLNTCSYTDIKYRLFSKVEYQTDEQLSNAIELLQIEQEKLNKDFIPVIAVQFDTKTIIHYKDFVDKYPNTELIPVVKSKVQIMPEQQGVIVCSGTMNTGAMIDRRLPIDRFQIENTLAKDLLSAKEPNKVLEEFVTMRKQQLKLEV